jgi:cytochrome oxidase Cu insertion factor (SCO1/SenC/PrrC family)
MKIISERLRSKSVLIRTLAALLAAATAAGCAPVASSHPAAGMSALAANPAVDPGSPAGNKPAPNFTLLDQFGHKVTLSQFHGKAVLLAFVDSHCSTVCPLTTMSMLEAVKLLGPAGKNVQLVGIDANPLATRVADVRDYSVAHGMMHSWEFLTGTLAQLKAVWRDYHVYVQAVKNNIDHEPAVYLITPGGRERLLFLTQMLYTGTDQQAQVLADATAGVLPGAPHVKQVVNLRYIPGIKPADDVSLPVAGGKASGKTVPFGRGHPHLVVFFATWVGENSNLVSEMKALNGYQQAAAGHGWPPVVAVDEASTETTPSALPSFLARLRGQLDYPVAVDQRGQLADGYGVQDQPWIALVSSSGKILFRHDGWLPEPGLASAVRKALGASS